MIMLYKIFAVLSLVRVYGSDTWLTSKKIEGRVQIQKIFL